jgi:hypothetical protein
MKKFVLIALVAMFASNAMAGYEDNKLKCQEFWGAKLQEISDLKDIWIAKKDKIKEIVSNGTGYSVSKSSFTKMKSLAEGALHYCISEGYDCSIEQYHELLEKIGAFSILKF